MNRAFDRFASAVSRWLGRPVAFTLSVVSVLIWAGFGPVFGYSDTWQMTVNTGTTVITYWMAFLILASSARDTAALNAKLDELIRVTAARDALIRAEELPQDDIEALRK